MREFLGAEDGPAAMGALQSLLENRAIPAVRRALSGKAGTVGIYHTGEHWDLEEVASHAKERLISKLLALRRRPDQNQIDEFGRYAAVTANHCWAEHLRKKISPTLDVEEPGALPGGRERFQIWIGALS